MLSAYSLQDGHLVECAIDHVKQLEPEALWIDLISVSYCSFP